MAFASTKNDSFTSLEKHDDEHGASATQESGGFSPTIIQEVFVQVQEPQVDDADMKGPWCVFEDEQGNVEKTQEATSIVDVPGVQKLREVKGVHKVRTDDTGSFGYTFRLWSMGSSSSPSSSIDSVLPRNSAKFSFRVSGSSNFDFLEHFQDVSHQAPAVLIFSLPLGFSLRPYLYCSS